VAGANFRNKHGWLLSALVGLVLLGAPVLLGEWHIAQLAQLFTYGIFAMGLAFLWGQSGLLCFGQAIFFGTGAYAMSLLTKGLVPGMPSGTLFGLLAAALLPGVVALGAGALLFRGKGLSGAFFSIVTLAAAVIVERAAGHWPYIGGFNGLMNVPPIRIGSAGQEREVMEALPIYYILLGAAAAVFGLLLWLERSPFGTGLRAIRDNEQRSRFLGIDIFRYKTACFALSASVSGLAGGLFVTQFGFVSPALAGVTLSTEVLIWAALGGREVLLAAFLGAILVRFVESVLSDTLGSYWLLVLGLLFVMVVVLFTSGLGGRVLALPLPKRLLSRVNSL
jgi:urea transport system permease protein